MESNVSQELHLAAQYLSACAINFLEKKDDDSHTNLNFERTAGTLCTRPLNEEGHKLCLNYNNFTLEWVTKDASNIMNLNESTHKDILKWIEQMRSESSIDKSFIYDFHYSIPYSIIDDYTFKKPNSIQLGNAIHARILAQIALEKFLMDKATVSEIRVWPHHFDTGALIYPKKDSNISISAGLAIPDTICNDYYFYISSYNGNSPVDTSDFKALKIGAWHNEGFKGAVLPIKDIDENSAHHFLEIVYNTYTS